MNRRLSVLAVSLIAAILVLSMLRIHPAAASADAEVVAFVGAKIYTSPTDPPISNGTVVIRGEKDRSGRQDGHTAHSSRRKADRLQGRSDYRRLSE